MREILFKAKRKDNGEWVEGYYVKGSTRHCILKSLARYPKWDIDPNTLCQFTGLLDKNGNKIWENDICSVLLICEDKTETENCIVRYGRKAENFKIELGFNVEWTKTDYLRCDICFWTENREVEVIGNIFDNPELIGGDTYGET